MELFPASEFAVMENVNDYDSCIVGVIEQFGRPPILCYDKAKVIDVLMENSSMTEEEALEFWDYNQIGSYVGDTTPCFLTRVEVYKNKKGDKHGRKN